MPDRRRLAVVATPLLGLLAAVLAGWSMAAAQEVSGDAGAGPLTLESATVTTITVTWDAVPGATRYDVRWRAPDGIFGPDQATTATRYEITGLSPGSPYVVRVHAIGADGATLKPFRGDFRTTLTAPASLTLTASTTTSLTVAWTAPAGWTPAGYRLSWRAEGGTPFQGSAQLAAGVRTRTITGLSHGTRYIVRLVALNAAGTESPFASITAAAREAGPTGARPLTLESATLTTLTVTWDAVPDAARYDVRWRAPDGVFGPDKAATGTRHEITGLSPGRPYVVRVHPIAAGGATLRQFRGDFRTTLTAPATLTVSAASATSLTVNWSIPTDWTPAGYLLSWRPVGGAPFQGSAQLAAGVVTHEITGLTDGTKYLIRLTALNPAGTESPPARLTATAADAAAPLTVTLTSSRDICTANTLTELSWTITGGKAPYRLSIDGEEVDRAAESHRINCGPIPETAAPDPAWEHLVEYRHARAFTATVTDARGVSATGTDLAELLPPLPAPVATVDADVMRLSMLIRWIGLKVSASCDVPGGCFAIRTRLAGGASWDYSRDEHEYSEGRAPSVRRYVDASGTTVEAGIAAMRHPIEIETPEALNWAATVQATSLTDISGLTATATHDTVTVRWNRQPSADTWAIGIAGAGGGQGKYIRGSEAAWGDPTSATHEVTFTDLPPNTEYRVNVAGQYMLEAGPEHVVAAETTVRTTVAPADHTALVRGPQNLRATATHNTITVQWDHPRPDVEDEYRLHIESAYGGRPDGPVWPPDSQYTFERLLPGTTYLVRVMHNDITRASAEITITTSAAPPATAAQGAVAQAAQRSAQTWPLTSPFAPVWPVPAYASTNDSERWAWFTDDVWVARTDGTARWHGGIDVGADNRGGGYRHPIQAIADGRVREFALTDKHYVVYCPGASGEGGHMIDDVFVQEKRDFFAPDDGTESDIKCAEIANSFHGRVAVTLHEYEDALYIVLYAHLYQFGSGDAADMTPDGAARPVAAGDVIGVEGGTRYYGGEFVEKPAHPMGYWVHLHLTVRKFTRRGAVGEVDKAQGADWRVLKSTNVNFNCANSSAEDPSKDEKGKQLEYCEAPREIFTMVDPEIVFPPAPPATTHKLPPAGAPTWVGPPNHVGSSYVNNVHRRFVLTGIDQAVSGGAVEAHLDIAAGRPRYYRSSSVADPREKAGVAGTADGVLGYFADAKGCAHGVSASAWNERTRSSAIGFSGHTTPQYWSEVEPLTLGIPILRGATCVITVRSYNATYSPWDAVPANAYGKDSDGENVRSPLPTARVQVHGDRLYPTGTPQPLPQDAGLGRFEFDIYEVAVEVGYSYEVATVVGAADDVVLQAWSGGEVRAENKGGPGPVTVTWEPTQTGVAYLVARGGMLQPDYEHPWVGNYNLTYSRTPAGPFQPPVISAFGVNTARTLAADFTWHGTADHTVQWEMEYIAPILGYPSIVLQLQDGVGDPWDGGPGRRITFKDAEAQAVGWYLLRGKVCEDSAAKDRTCGGWSAWKGRSPLPLAEPKNVAATPGTGSVDLAWTEAGDPDGYELRVDGGASKPIEPVSVASGASGASDGDSKARTYTVPDLTPGTSYKLELRATDAQATGEYEDLASDWVAVTVTTFPSPPVITGFALDSDGHPSVSFTWGEPATSSYFLTWELHRSDSEDGTYALHKPTVSRSASPASFGARPSGWYKARGQVCIRDDDEVIGGAQGAVDNPDLTCGEWTAFSDPIAVKPTLSALSLSGVTLSPTFASGTLAYTASVSHSVSRTTVAATATESTATVSITPADADTNTAGHQVNLASGAKTTITVTVAAANDGPSSSYTVAVTRASAPVTCGTRPTKPATTDPEDLDPTYVWEVGEDKATEKITTGTRTRTRDVTWLGYPSCRWQEGNWSAWVYNRTTTDGEVKTRPADVMSEEETANDNTEWRAEATKACEWQQYDVQPIRKRATWSSANEAWEFPQDWENDPNKSATTRWRKTTNCKAKPADETRNLETANDNIGWRVDATTACEWQQYDVQPQKRTAAWSDENEAWEFKDDAWVNNGTATTTWERTTTACKDKPPDRTVLVNSSPFPQTRWVTDPDIPFCILWEEKRTRYWTTLYYEKFVWSSSATDWVGQLTPPPLPVAYYTYTEWERTGDTKACPRSAQEDGVEGEAESVALAAGDYTLPWGLQRISFTVPAGASVELSLRALESGVQAVVLTSAAGAELVLYPGALADGAKPSPSAADTTLSSIAGTLVLTSVERVAPPPAPANETCAVVTAAASGATAVDMGASLCAAVPTGALSVALGGQTLSLTLPTGYDWLLLRVSPDPAVVGIIDMGSGAYLALDAATGAEESREVGEDVAATIGPIFDAIVTSATPPPAESDGS